jgi:hypothetical protein
LKKLLTILFVFSSLHLFAAGIGTQKKVVIADPYITGKFYNTYHITFPSDGHMSLTPDLGYIGGDFVYISKGTTITAPNEDNMTVEIDNFTNVHPYDGNGYVTFTWEATEAALINNSSWNGGAFGSTLKIFNSQRIRFVGTPTNLIKILGGTNDANRTNSFNVELNHFVYKFEVGYLEIHDGGTGVQMKTEATSDSATWDGRRLMDSCWLHHIHVHHSWNESFYIGPTSPFICVYHPNPDSVGYVPQIPSCSTAVPDTNTNFSSPTGFYKRTLIYHKFTINDCFTDSSGGDSFQFAAIDSLTGKNLYAYEWAYVNAEGHKWGLLDGGRITNSYYHNVILKHSLHGDGIACFSMGPDHVFDNILLDSIHTGFPIFIKQGDAGACGNNSTSRFTHITVSRSQFSPVYRNTPAMGAHDSIEVTKNLWIDIGPDPGFGFYIDFWSESSPPKNPWYKVAWGANQNLHYNTVADAVVDPNYYMQKLTGSPIADQGYIHDNSWIDLGGGGSGGSPSPGFRFVLSKGATIIIKYTH